MYTPPSKAREPAPKQNGQPDHKEGVCAEVGGDGEVTIERRRAHLVLKDGEIGCLPPHEGEKALSQGVSPWWKCSPVCWSLVSAVTLQTVGVVGASVRSCSRGETL